MISAVSFTFFINRTRGQVELLRQDGVGGRAALLRQLQYGFKKGGIGRRILKPWAQFLKPGFHPWDIDDHDLIAKGEAMLEAMKPAPTPRVVKPVPMVIAKAA